VHAAAAPVAHAAPAPDVSRLPVIAAGSAVHAASSPPADGVAATPPALATAIDPVCHMTVTIATARHVGTWDGRTWYFCNPRCKDKFLADPARYLDAASAGAAR
jgi:YHS domain-containing protein